MEIQSKLDAESFKYAEHQGLMNLIEQELGRMEVPKEAKVFGRVFLSRVQVAFGEEEGIYLELGWPNTRLGIWKETGPGMGPEVLK